MAIEKTISGGEVTYTLTVKVEQTDTEEVKEVLDRAVKGVEAQHKQSGMNHLTEVDLTIDFVAKTREEFITERETTGKTSYVITMRYFEPF